MASACVNNIPTTYPNTHNNWFSPRTSLSHDYTNNNEQPPSKSDLESSSSNNAGDFNFQLASNTVAMLPADELFSDGKLLPLHLSTPKPPQLPSHLNDDNVKVPISPQKEKASENDNPYLFSPKAPRCSSRWKELLGLTRPSLAPTSNTSSGGRSSIRQLLNRNSKTASPMSLPLLKDSSSSSTSSSSSSLFSVAEADNNVHSSSRLSLSSSSSSSHDELPRLSLDSEKPASSLQQPKRSLSSGPRMRPVRPRTKKKETTTTTIPTRGGMTIESPRMGPSGRVVFESLERSSSCPSSFNGGLRYNKNNYKGVMERSYSGNVTARITPVLNVPVCSLRGSSKFGFANLFSSSSQSHKKEGSNVNNSNNINNSYVKNYNIHTSTKIKDKIKETS